MFVFRAGFGAALAATAIVVACAPQGPGPLTDADKAAMQQVVDNALEIMTSATPDWTAFVTGFYAEDVTVMPPNGPVIKGRDAIVAFLESFPPITEMKMERQQIDGSGTLAYDIETYTSMATPPDLAAIADTGKLVWVWQKQADGSWRVLVEIWNSDLPAGTLSPEAVAQQTKE
jgi:ketosteroid isomerase-like protein